MGKSYYVFSSGRIRRKENTLFLENEQGKKVIPVEDVDDFYFFGELDLNTKFINFLSQQEITIHFLGKGLDGELLFCMHFDLGEAFYQAKPNQEQHQTPEQDLSSQRQV